MDLAAPSARGLHSAVWTGDGMILWGGFDRDMNALADGYRYDTGADAWTPIATTGAPAARGGHTAVWTGTEMIVWGGFDGAFGARGDGGRYDPRTNTWAPLAVAGAPSVRGGHSAVWTGTEMVVWGGLVSIAADNGQRGDGGRWNPQAGVWTSLPASATGPSARGGHSAVWTGTEMIVWGGRNTASGELRVGATWNPSTGVWKPFTTYDAPAQRRFHGAVWTGTEMVVWGGALGSTNLASGGTMRRTP